MKVLNELGISIPVCGMVKDDHHRTRGLYFNNVEIPIDTSGEGFRLITRIQDEATGLPLNTIVPSGAGNRSILSWMISRGSVIPGGKPFCVNLNLWKISGMHRRKNWHRQRA